MSIEALPYVTPGKSLKKYGFTKIGEYGLESE
jgi:hypothetical protein